MTGPTTLIKALFVGAAVAAAASVAASQSGIGATDSAAEGSGVSAAPAAALTTASAMLTPSSSTTRAPTLGAPVSTPTSASPVEATAAIQEYQGSDYTGQFTFVRIRFDLDLGGFRGGGREPPWAHDYPKAERNFLRILEETTAIDRHPDGTKILRTDDPALFQYPVAYISEPGFWRVSDAEVAGLRAWLLKGGFLIADDFRGPDWYTFESVMEEVVPELTWVELDIDQEVFDSFFRIESLAFSQPPGYGRGFRGGGRGGSPQFFGLYENNDQVNGRLMVVANYNNDIGDYWEWSDAGFIPIDLSNEAYKLGVNYIVYALTH